MLKSECFHTEDTNSSWSFIQSDRMSEKSASLISSIEGKEWSWHRKLEGRDTVELSGLMWELRGLGPLAMGSLLPIICSWGERWPVLYCSVFIPSCLCGPWVGLDSRLENKMNEKLQLFFLINAERSMLIWMLNKRLSSEALSLTKEQPTWGQVFLTRSSSALMFPPHRGQTSCHWGSEWAGRAALCPEKTHNATVGESGGGSHQKLLIGKHISYTWWTEATWLLIERIFLMVIT